MGFRVLRYSFCLFLMILSFSLSMSLVFSADFFWDGGVSLDYASASFLGENSLDKLGYSVSGVGDVNGDGFDDFMVGAYDFQNGDDRGRTYLFYGNATGWDVDINVNNADLMFTGESLDNYFGFSVSDAGDVNGDGYDDILISAKSHNYYRGKTYLIFGCNNDSGIYSGECWLKQDLDVGMANATFSGVHQYEHSGQSISGLGDVNGDGFDDFIIGAHANNEGAGSHAGKSYLILGRSSGWGHVTVTSSNASFIGETDGEYSGWDVSGAGDVNGDGFDDFLIGAYMYDSGVGKAYLIFGNSSGWSNDVMLSDIATEFFLDEYSLGRAGYSVSGAGDINNDGFDDFLIGAYDEEYSSINAEGVTYLFYGSQMGWGDYVDLADYDLLFYGEHWGDFAGWSVSKIGNFNGDDYDDFMIYAAANDRGGSSAGSTHVFFGRNESMWGSAEIDLIDADVIFIGQNADDGTDSVISGVGDVNGDGYDDFMIGSSANDDNSRDAGKSYLVLSSFLPDMDSFGSESTNVSLISDIARANNFKLVGSKSESRVSWIDSVNINSADLDSNVVVADRIISINSEGLDSSLDSQAWVELANVNCSSDSLFYYDRFSGSVDTIVKSGVLMAKPPYDELLIKNCTDLGICSQVTCNASSGVLRFKAEHFDSFGAGSGSEAVPEFSDYAMILALTLVVGLFIHFRKR